MSYQEFFGGPVTKTLCPQCREGLGSTPGQELDPTYHNQRFHMPQWK